TRVGHRVAINSRHQGCLLQARQAGQAALKAMVGNASPELIAMDVREALEHVGDVVGKTDTEDLLGEIFSTFCIGK
ncbi:MAG: tRNA uridine-5-carboxymethylaminomethyl(34) synthesis GTPase MnmE, partial [Verrucomicrobiota bacterium]